MFWNVFDRLLRIALVAIVALYVVLGIYFVAGRLLMPQLPNYASTIAGMLQERTGLAWQIEGLRGEWRWLNPVIRFDAVQVPGTEGLPEPTLEVRGTELELDFTHSLIDRQLRFKVLHVEQLGVTLERDAEGRWRLPGMRSTTCLRSAAARSRGSCMNA